MALRIDTRDHGFKRPLNAAAISFGAAPVAGARSSAIHPETGTPTVLAPPPGPPAKGSMLDRATTFVRSASAAFAAPTEAFPEYVPDPHIAQTSSGAAAVHLQQHYQGVPVFEMARTVRFAPDGTITAATGTDVVLARDLGVLPKLDVREAAKAAAQHVAAGDATGHTDGWGQKTAPPKLDVTGFAPTILATFPLPSRPTVLDKGVFDEPIPAHLVVFYQGPKTRLGWHFIMTLPEAQAQYVVIVSADSEKPELLYCQESSWSIVQGKVFQTSPGRGTAVELDWPIAVDRYPLKSVVQRVPEGFPRPWVAKDECVGNSTVAVLGNSTKSLKGRVDGDRVTFAPTDEVGKEILNIFYFCNFMHDFFYLLGFDEAAGNFQEINFTGNGLGSDPVLAKAHPQPVPGTANMTTRVDGLRAVMNMGPVQGTGRHTAFDADVVFHEYVHGVTNRLVGARTNDRALLEPQSRGMGEGWGDYFALTIQNHGQPSERVVTGDWVINDRAGIRDFPYDENFPDGFGALGTGRYREEHNIGEIWCATLMQMNRAIGKALGDRETGTELGWQLVVDALKLTPANPSFLDARDAIFFALDDMRNRPNAPMSVETYEKVRKAIWGAFAKFGMGPNAQTNGPQLDACVPDTTLPADL